MFLFNKGTFNKGTVYMAVNDTETSIPFDPASEGWSLQAPHGFMGTVGPLWERRDEHGLRLGILAEPKHINAGGIMHGGAIMAFADQALGTAGWEATGHKPQVTVQLDVQFISAVAIGEFLTAQCEVVRLTRSMIFLRGTFLVGSRVAATASGVWKFFDRRRSAGSHPQVDRSSTGNSAKG